MAWVLTADLTDEYIQSLITRNGFTDVTSTWNADHGTDHLYVIIDLDGGNHSFDDMNSTRSYLITQYCLIQNG